MRYGYQPPTGRELAAQARRLLRHVAGIKAVWDQRDEEHRQIRERVRRWAASERRHVVTPTVGWRRVDAPWQDGAGGSD